ncbi:TonB-dependent receptor [Luteimonas saliphila]|uniref:TonB-dependent receptor n=1 Tax=Luteimonas saliphila TaxID=2804919 RepID=UPI001EE37783|nr:TonB-dependent receptor [Luteimonas saliphila]
MNRNTMHHDMLAWAVALALGSVAANAHAAGSPQAETDPQSQPQAQPARDEVPTTLDALIVTAQKREEALQDVPITMSVLPEQLLQDAGARDIKEMQTLVSGLSVSSTSSESQTTVRIRGVGTVGDNPGLESSVGVVIDGVYRPRNGVGFGDLGPVERIEVLKGPQGTVFGKNTSAGLINIITRSPGFNQGAEAEVTVGNYGAIGVAAGYNDAFSDTVAFSVHAVKRVRDGFMDVETGAGPRTSREDGDQNFHSLRGQLLFEPNDDLRIRLIADYANREEECCAAVTTTRGPTAAIVNALVGGNAVIPVPDPDRRLAYGNDITRQSVEDKGVSAQVDWDMPWLGNATLTSITAAREWKNIGAQDLDFTTAPIWTRFYGEGENDVGFETFSQELRLTGSGERIDWMAGVFYADEDLVRNDSITMGPAYEPYLSIALLSNIAASFPPGLVDTSNPALFLSQAAGRPYGTTFVGPGSHDHFEQNARSTALFTNNVWHASDALDVTFGARYTRERKQLASTYANPNGGVGCLNGLTNPAQVGAALGARGVPGPYIAALVPTVIGYMCLPWSNVQHHGRRTRQEREEEEWSGALRASYRWNDSLMTYASAARGYKAGGFNLDRVQSANGLSSGAAGITPVDDTSFPGEFVDSYEIGAKSTLAGGNLLFNAALFHQTFSDFQLNSFIGTSYVVRSIPELRSRGLDLDLMWRTPVDGLSLQGGATYLRARFGDDLLPDADLALLPGATPGFMPRWQANASATWEWDIAERMLGRAYLGARYTADHNTGSDLDPQKFQQAYTLVDARLVLGARDRRWSVELWGRNLTDETYSQVGFDAPIQTGSWNAFLGAPRTYGVTLRLMY